MSNSEILANAMVEIEDLHFVEFRGDAIYVRYYEEKCKFSIARGELHGEKIIGSCATSLGSSGENLRSLLIKALLKTMWEELQCRASS